MYLKKWRLTYISHAPKCSFFLELTDFDLVDAGRKEAPIVSNSHSCPVLQPTKKALDILLTLWLKKQTVRPSVVSQFHIYRDNSTTLNFEGTRSKYQMRYDQFIEQSS